MNARVFKSLHTRRGFTLVELMISIALVLLLMLGINQVFKVTGEAVGTSQAVSSGIREARSAQSVLSDDFGAIAIDSPAIIIRSERISAFRNNADRVADADYAEAVRSGNATSIERAKRTIDIDGNGNEGEAWNVVPGEVIPPAIYNDRSHRADMVSFFARGLFRRQTGGGTYASGSGVVNDYAADMTAPEAWIWYGHLRRPDLRTPLNTKQGFEHRDPGDEPDPAAGNPVYNDDNYYATDWVLGRMAMCLVEPVDTDEPPDGRPDILRDDVKQYFIDRPATAALDNLTPLSRGSDWNVPNSPPSQTWEIQWSRFDVAGTSISGYRTILQNAITAGGPTFEWWDDTGIVYRFQGDPRPLRPMTPDSAARTSPVFLEHCTQFIVEFAGDFFEQEMTGANAGHVRDVDGNGTAFEADGHIDFIVINAGQPNEIRRTRWYGLPRNVDTNDDQGRPFIKGVAVPNAPQNPNYFVTGTNAMLDVVPVRDIAVASGLADPSAAPEYFERELPPQTPNYADPVSGLQPDATGANGHRYVAAWGPDNANFPRASMIRIVLTIDDPQGRVAEGQTFEYVYKIGG